MTAVDGAAVAVAARSICVHGDTPTRYGWRRPYAMGCWRPEWSCGPSRDRVSDRVAAASGTARGLRAPWRPGRWPCPPARRRAARRAARAGVVEVVPGPETVLVAAPGADLAGCGRGSPNCSARRSSRRADRGSPPEEPVTVPRGLRRRRIWISTLGPTSPSGTGRAHGGVARHTGRELVVGWLGFAPGFALSDGLDPALHVPRLATPRTSVPAGVGGDRRAVPGDLPLRLAGRVAAARPYDDAGLGRRAPSRRHCSGPGTRVRFAEAEAGT